MMGEIPHSTKKTVLLYFGNHHFPAEVQDSCENSHHFGEKLHE